MMFNTLWSLCVFMAFGVHYSKAQAASAHSRAERGVTYIFPENRNCTKYENAILREGAKLAWEVAGHSMSEWFPNEHDLTQEFHFTLNQHNHDVPYVRIVDYDLDLMEATLDVDLHGMEVFTRSNNLKYITSNNARMRRQLNHRSLGNDACCYCRDCQCCPWAACAKPNDCRRRALRTNEDERRKLTRSENLLRDIGIPVFQMLSVGCVDASDLIVKIG